MVNIQAKLSLIIPHYNAYKTLDRLLASAQQFNGIEIIVVDDKSGNIPEVSRIANKYNNVRMYHNTTAKKGAGVCRNIGLQHATGEWLLFADSDDYFIEEAAATVASAINFSVNEAVDVVYFSATSRFDDTNEVADRHYHTQEMVRDYLSRKDQRIRYSFNEPWSKLIRHQCIKENNITFEETLVSNDVWFSIKLGLHADKIHAIDKAIYCVTRSKGSLTTIYNPEIRKLRLEVHLRCNDYLTQHGKAKYCESLLFIIQNYHKHIYTVGWHMLVKKYLVNGWPIFPRYYLKYFRNPSKILDRFVLKKNSHKAKAYITDDFS